jgi:hypothetical protein
VRKNEEKINGKKKKENEGRGRTGKEMREMDEKKGDVLSGGEEVKRKRGGYMGGGGKKKKKEREKM